MAGRLLTGDRAADLPEITDFETSGARQGFPWAIEGLAEPISCSFRWEKPVPLRGISTLDVACLVNLFLIAPIYVVLMLAGLFWRSHDEDTSRRTVSRSLRLFANLLPVASASAFLVYEKILQPLLPGHYSDVGFLATWGCILLPLPLALMATFWIPPRLYRAASSWRWMALYGVVTGLLALKTFS
jgi:hypothetical protein